MRTLDEEIARRLKETADSGEPRRTHSIELMRNASRRSATFCSSVARAWAIQGRVPA